MYERSLKQDAESYWLRNSGQHHPEADPIEPMLDRIHSHSPIQYALEVGAGDGWRLERMQRRYGCTVLGIDASDSAAAASQVPVRGGIAPEAVEALSLWSFDLVVLGFFGYLLHRSKMLRLAAAVDRVLLDDGHVVVVDFLAPYPTRAKYAHHEGLQVFKQDTSALWTGSPDYVLVDRTLIEHPAHDVDNADPARWIVVDVIRKLPEHRAWAAADQVRSRTA